MTCDLCGRKIRSDVYVYSRWTKHHYCGTNACFERRRRQLRKKGAPAGAPSFLP